MSCWDIVSVIPGEGGGLGGRGAQAEGGAGGVRGARVGVLHPGRNILLKYAQEKLRY